jgi:hypothetical protein
VLILGYAIFRIVAQIIIVDRTETALERALASKIGADAGEHYYQFMLRLNERNSFGLMLAATVARLP